MIDGPSSYTSAMGQNHFESISWCHNQNDLNPLGSLHVISDMLHLRHIDLFKCYAFSVLQGHILQITLPGGCLRQKVPTLQWRYNERTGVWNHRRLDCLLNRLIRHRSKKSSKLRVTGLCEGNPPITGDFPRKGSVTRKMFPFDDIIMQRVSIDLGHLNQYDSRRPDTAAWWMPHHTALMWALSAPDKQHVWCLLKSINQAHTL